VQLDYSFKVDDRMSSHIPSFVRHTFKNLKFMLEV
jgi:hypothetical protein